MRSPRLLVHETRLSAVCKAHPSLLSGSFLFEPDESPHLNPKRTDCVRVQRSVTSFENWLVGDSSFITSPRVIVNHTPSARVIIVIDNNLYYLYLM